jgi:hypothetical protein
MHGPHQRAGLRRSVGEGGAGCLLDAEGVPVGLLVMTASMSLPECPSSMFVLQTVSFLDGVLCSSSGCAGFCHQGYV